VGDVYASLNRLHGPNRGPGPIIEAAFWAHERCKLYNLAAVAKGSIAAEVVRRIDELFAIERDINGESAEERLAVREERARPLAIELEAWLHAWRERVSCKAEIGKKIAYPLNHWHALTQFLKDGRICSSNNAVERALRGIAVGRRSWTFAGCRTFGPGAYPSHDQPFPIIAAGVRDDDHRSEEAGRIPPALR
jgi:transposase